MFTFQNPETRINRIDENDSTTLIKILIFDEQDVLLDVQNVLQVLKNLRFHYFLTNNDSEFKNILKNERPHLVISELLHDEELGKKLLHYCRMVYPETTFIFLSNHSCNKSVLNLLEEGATDFLLKENISDLPGTIFKALRQSREKLQIKDAKQKRWEDSQRFKGLIEFSQDPVITYSENGTITYASPAIERVLGYKVEEFIGTNVLDHIHPDDQNSRHQKFEYLKNDNQNNFAEIDQERLLHKNGHYIWAKAIISDARLLPGIEGYMTNFRDITETVKHKLKLEKTLKSLTDYKIALDESSIVGITDLKGKITYANQELLTISNYQMGELLGKDFRIFQSDEHTEFYYLKIWNTIYRGQIWKGELKLKAKNNRFFWVSATVVPFSDENHKPYQYIVVMRDITLIKLRTLELHNTIDLLTNQNKRLLNFSYIVSHNLRSHTSNIQNLINHIDEAEDEEEKNELIQHLRNVANALNETMHNLNEVVSIQSNSKLKVETINLNSFLNNTINILKTQLSETNAVITTNIPEDLEISFSLSYLESILQNLILNALKYKHPQRNPIIKIDFETDGNYKILSITDNGIGINIEKYKDKLFGMYKTFHSNLDSKGLGLFMSKNQIEALGGKIEVESEINVGTTFKLFIK